MTRDSNHGRHFQSATFRGCVAYSGTCVQFGMHSLSSVSAEGDRQCQRESATVFVHTLLMFPQYLGTRITSQPFIKQIYALAHLVATTSHPYKINGLAVS
ncbi:hypothetical protein MTP99_002533 [Tenebrio molitor]|nr:hypothetical protein MTP99_002533 [Tenebrio molitor]